MFFFYLLFYTKILIPIFQKQSKALIEGLPKVIFEGATPSEAEQWKKQLEEHGCEIELV